MIRCLFSLIIRFGPHMRIVFSCHLVGWTPRPLERQAWSIGCMYGPNRIIKESRHGPTACSPLQKLFRVWERNNIQQTGGYPTWWTWWAFHMRITVKEVHWYIGDPSNYITNDTFRVECTAKWEFCYITMSHSIHWKNHPGIGWLPK